MESCQQEPVSNAICLLHTVFMSDVQKSLAPLNVSYLLTVPTFLTALI